MMQLCFASFNLNKIAEIQELAGKDYLILTLQDCGFTAPIPETGSTLEENARLKAEFAYKKIIVHCFADDSGLEVEALEGAPGVFSSRYSGEGATDKENIDLLLKNLHGETNRRARFRTVIHLIFNKSHHTFEGLVNGTIADTPRGDGGFGYDSVFIPEGKHLTFAEMSQEEKNTISHRSIAVNQLFSFLKQSEEVLA